MIITGKDIKSQLYELWPDLEMLETVTLLDKNFWMPKVSEIEEFFKSSEISKMQFIDEFNDCDDFAQFFLVEIKKKRYEAYMKGELPKEQALPLSIGRAVGDLFRGMSTMHVTDLAICQEGRYVFDLTPMSNRFWKASSSSDNVLIFEI